MTDGTSAAQAQHSFRRQLSFWLVILAGVILFLILFHSILLPFVAGMALAYLLDPVAKWFERRGIGRLAATLLILLAFVIIFIIVLVTLVPLIVGQLTAFVEGLPDLVAELEALLQPLLQSRVAEFFGIDGSNISGSMTSVVGEGAGWLAGLLGSIWTGGQALIAIASLLVVTPVVAFYLLYDWDRMITRIDSWLPRQHAPVIRDLARQMSRAIAGFVRGQGLVCIILGAFYATTLAVIGLDYGLVIGLAAGVLSFIPFVGSVFGFVVSVGVAAVQFWPDWIWIATTAVIFIVGQFFEGYVLQPRLVGSSVGLHPVWLMFALFAFGLLFGFVGALVAVPLAAVVGVLVRFALQRYLASPYYRGSDSAPEEPSAAP